MKYDAWERLAGLVYGEGRRADLPGGVRAGSAGAFPTRSGCRFRRRLNRKDESGDPKRPEDTFL